MTGYRLSDDTHVEDFDDELVLIELRSEQVFSLDGTAVVMFRAVVETGSTDAALPRIAEVLGFSDDRIATDLEAFCDDMAERQIFVRQP